MARVVRGPSPGFLTRKESGRAAPASGPAQPPESSTLERFLVRALCVHRYLETKGLPMPRHSARFAGCQAAVAVAAWGDVELGKHQGAHLSPGAGCALDRFRQEQVGIAPVPRAPGDAEDAEGCLLHEGIVA